MNREHALASIRRELSAGASTLQATAAACADDMLDAAERIAQSLRNGGKLMLCGNGGSAADAQHLAAELVGRMSASRERPALAGWALTTDSSILTAVSNDYAFARVFARQVEALGRPGDVLLAISTSGNSENVVQAVQAAASSGVGTIGLLGQQPSRLAELVEIAIRVPATDVQQIQQGHIAVGHLLCSLVEELSLSPTAFEGRG